MSELQVTAYCLVSVNPFAHMLPEMGCGVIIRIRLETRLHGILYAQECEARSLVDMVYNGPPSEHQVCVGGQWYEAIDHPTHRQDPFLNPSVWRVFYEAYQGLAAWLYSVPNFNMLDIEAAILQSRTTHLPPSPEVCREVRI